jgi:hypothetical protein
MPVVRDEHVNWPPNDRDFPYASTGPLGNPCETFSVYGCPGERIIVSILLLSVMQPMVAAEAK